MSGSRVKRVSRMVHHLSDHSHQHHLHLLTLQHLHEREGRGHIKVGGALNTSAWLTNY